MSKVQLNFNSGKDLQWFLMYQQQQEPTLQTSNDHHKEMAEDEIYKYIHKDGHSWLYCIILAVQSFADDVIKENPKKHVRQIALAARKLIIRLVQQLQPNDVLDIVQGAKSVQHNDKRVVTSTEIMEFRQMIAEIKDMRHVVYTRDINDKDLSQTKIDSSLDLRTNQNIYQILQLISKQYKINIRFMQYITNFMNKKKYYKDTHFNWDKDSESVTTEKEMDEQFRFKTDQNDIVFLSYKPIAYEITYIAKKSLSIQDEITQETPSTINDDNINIATITHLQYNNKNKKFKIGRNLGSHIIP